MLRHALRLCLLIVLATTGLIATPMTHMASAQSGGATPVSIRIPQALVDTAIEPLRIVNAIPQMTSSPWTVGWYQETGRLGSPGNPVLFGHAEWPAVGKAALFFADQLQPGDDIEITGSDTRVHNYSIDWIEAFPRHSAPIQEIFAEPRREQILTLYFNALPKNPDTGDYDNVIVIRARAVSASASIDAVTGATTLGTRQDCPVPPASLELPWSMRVYPYPVIPPSTHADRTQMGFHSASPANERTIQAIDEVIAGVTPCDVSVRVAIDLPDGFVLALVGPSGDVPYREMVNAISTNEQGVLNSVSASLFAFMLFAEEDDGWRHVPHPVG